MKRFSSAVGALAASALLLAPAAAFARATIVIHNLNGPGEGFNDPTAVQPVGGNPGITLGEQRLIAFEYAASIWGATLDSSQTIVIDARFSALQCDATSAVLGSAAPESEESADNSFPNKSVWYPSALANAFGGRDFDTSGGDIVANFNENLGQSNCLPGYGWYLGLDGKASGTENDLPTVLLHEFSHGLGFLTYADQGGKNLNGIPDIFETYAYDDGMGKYWIDMTDTERAASTLHPDQVVWTGSSVNAMATSVLHHKVVMSITAPAGSAADLDFSGAEFGPAVTTGFTGNVAVVQDANGGSATDACHAVKGVSGKIALVDRLPKSTTYTPCSFKTKASNVQAAGAIGMIVADYPNDGSPPGGMADDPSVTATINIPSVFVSNDSGTQLRNAISSGTTTVLFHPSSAYAGADSNNNPYLFTPATYQGGSSVSHWSLDASGPSLLMEPYIHPDIPRGLDLTPSFMKDIGWTIGPDITVALIKAGPVEAWPGGTAQYLISVLNHGSTDATGVTVDATTPTGLTFQGITGGGCTAFPCNLGTVTADSSVTLVASYQIPLDYTTPDPVVEKVNLSFNSGSTDSATFTSTVQQAADLSVTANVPAQFKGGDQTPVPVTVTNNGPSVANGIDVTTNSPTQVDFAGFSGDCSGSTCHFDTLQPGESKTVNVLVKASGDKVASFRVAVAGTTNDPNTVNNEAIVKANVASGGCTAPGSASFLSLVVLAGGLMLRRRQRA